jgi:chemotaxis response regulator CheB
MTDVALLVESKQLGEHLQRALAEAGLDVKFRSTVSDLDVDALGASAAQAIVVNLEPEVEDHLDHLEEMLAEDERPLIFNDASASSALSGWDAARWARHLAVKITGRGDVLPPRPLGPVANTDGAAPARNLATPAPLVTPAAMAERVVVLGASIGGPEAVRVFLGNLPRDIPAAFILAQHMGPEFLEIMAGQLAKASSLKVRLAEAGQPFRHGEVLVTPVGQRLTINRAGLIEFGELPEKSPFSPCIDQVMFDAAARYGANASAIVFSGMAQDGIRGSLKIRAVGGEVWIQDPETCVVTSMVDGARDAGVVSFVGSPQKLAERLTQKLMPHLTELLATS